MNKKGIWIGLIVAAIVVVAGVSAAAILNKNPKQQYFSAEKASWDFMTEVVEDRYGDELEWMDQMKETPNESTIELSASYNDPSGFDTMGIQPLINNSSITIENSVDPENKEMTAALSAGVAGISLEDIKLYVTADKAMASLPFLDKYVQVKESDLSGLLHTFDPIAFTGEEEINFDALFNQEPIPEEDLEYIQDTYLKLIYDELPEEAFTSEEESVDVNEESMQATKVTLALSEEQIKSIIEKVLTEAEDDERLKEIITQQSSSPIPYTTEEIEQLTEEYDTAIAEAKTGLEDVTIPDGLISTIWIDNDLIVKRDVAIKIGPSEAELAELSLVGTQSLQNNTQTFDYALEDKNPSNESTVNVTGDLSWQDGSADDSIKLSSEDTELTYSATEQLVDGTREFDRTFAFSDPASPSPFELNWNGKSTYDQDQMNADHHVSFIGEGLSEDIFQLNVTTDAALVKSIDAGMDDKEVVDLGAMSEAELETYMTQEFSPQLQQWLMMFMGAGF
ncbi:DUF6583 family protein [Aquibacillus sediminis]|uniref:DUF6583 family protein n=1 Tax=Aquibacillus sediminis TaxID=2574734 RepID=UPI00110824EF|nr:DUF6583 family protein [Aquibacillus sediminis]